MMNDFSLSYYIITVTGAFLNALQFLEYIALNSTPTRRLNRINEQQTCYLRMNLFACNNSTYTLLLKFMIVSTSNLKTNYL